MIHVIEGDGNGKTTASVGLAVRATGHGWKVLFVQFLKDDSSGEIESLKKLGVEVLHAVVNYGFSFQMDESQLKETAKQYMGLINSVIKTDAQLIILDEIIYALNAGLVKMDKLEKILDKESEIVLTGRNAPAWIKERADYVSNIQKIKHPYDRGVVAREGIEF